MFSVLLFAGKANFFIAPAFITTFLFVVHSSSNNSFISISFYFIKAPWKVAKSNYWPCPVHPPARPSVLPHWTFRLLLQCSSWNLIWGLCTNMGTLYQYRDSVLIWGLYQYRDSVPIWGLCTNMGTLNQYGDSVPIWGLCTNMGTLYQYRDSVPIWGLCTNIYPKNSSSVKIEKQ